MHTLLVRVAGTHKGRCYYRPISRSLTPRATAFTPHLSCLVGNASTPMSKLLDGNPSDCSDIAPLDIQICELRRTLLECDEVEPERPHHLRQLADMLNELFQSDRCDDMTLAEETLDLRKTALILTPPNDPNICLYKYDLALSLSGRFDETGHVEYLQSAVTLLRDVIDSPASAVELLPARSDLLLQYALWTQNLFRLTSLQADIDASISAFIEYHDAIPDDHRTRKLARCFWMTATAMLERHAKFPSDNTLDGAFAVLEQSSRVPSATPFDILNASIIWAQEAEKWNHFSELEAYRHAFTLLPQFIWFGYGLRIRQSRLEASHMTPRLPARAANCAIRFGRLELAVEWLDEGRSVLWGQMLALRNSLDGLRKLYPELAERFDAAGRALEGVSSIDEAPLHPGTTQPFSRLDISDVSEIKALHIAEWNHILNDIRANPPFSRFLMPRLYSELKHISCRGPVFIINLAVTHSDALILPSPCEPIIHIVLPDMTLAQASHLKGRLAHALNASGRLVRENRPMKRVEKVDEHGILRSILTHLWFMIAEPILARLNLNGDNGHLPLPRVWWCPTGALIDLPIHAAGLYSPLGNVCVSDFVISSYAPMLSTLLPSPSDTEPSFILQSPRTLAIGQAHAKHASMLPGTIREMERIRQICGQGVISLEGAQANTARVVSELRSAELVHIACHGRQIDSGFNSALILHDGQLPVSQLIRQRVPLGRLAFLSACETAKSSLATPDEVINIATAMLFAGFRGVVATLWSMDDKDGPFVSELYYRHLFQTEAVDTRNAAIALHLAVQQLRDSGAPLMRWVPFIHVGV